MTAGSRHRHARAPAHRLVTRAAAILLILVPASVLAERFGGSVGGRVAAGASSTPVPSARVTLEPQRRDGPPRVALTGDSGEYLFEDVPPGVYRLTVAAENFRERRLAEIAVAAGSDVRVDPSMEPAHAERIIVRGETEREGSDLSRTRLGRGALQARPAALEDPFRALAGRSGIAPENDFQSQMRIRGGDTSDTEVLLDGQPLPYPYHFGGSAGSAGALNGDLVDSVEVQTGGFSVEYGDALAGVIDLSTRDRRPDRTTGTTGLGSLLGHAALAGPVGEGYWIASGRMSDLGLYDNRVAGDGVQGVTFHDLFAALRLPLTPAARMEAAFLEAGNGFEADLGHAGRASMQGEHRGGRVRLDVPVDPRTLLRVQLSAGDLSVGSSVTGGMGFDQGQTRQDLRLSALRLLGEAHRLNLGLSLQRTRGGMLGTVYDGYDLAPSALAYDSRAAGAFLEDTWRPSGALELRYGLRGDRSSWSGESALSPRVSFEARPTPGLSLRLAAGRFVQFPRQEQIFLAAGEPLRMQTADHVIVGVERTWGARLRLVVEGYRKLLRNPIGEAVNRYIELPEMVTRFDRGTVQGAELTLEGPAAGPWDWGIHYGVLAATQEKDGLETPRNTDQRQSAGLFLDRRFGRGWEAGAAFRYGSGLPYTPLRPWTDGLEYGTMLGELNSARLPAFHRLDLRVSRSMPVSWGSFAVHVDLLNVCNRTNVRSIDLYYDAAGGVFYRTTAYQSPFLPVVGLTADF